MQFLSKMQIIEVKNRINVFHGFIYVFDDIDNSTFSNSIGSIIVRYLVVNVEEKLTRETER